MRKREGRRKRGGWCPPAARQRHRRAAAPPPHHRLVGVGEGPQVIFFNLKPWRTPQAQSPPPNFPGVSCCT
jgi:hypothetical protein